MRFDVMTLFPEMVYNAFSESIIHRAIQKGLIDIACHNIRDYTADRQKRVDDAPYGGGMGMIMQVQPISDCFKAICEQLETRPHLIYMSPQGAVFTQRRALELSKIENIAILCGHYEGVDERVIEMLVDEEITIGDYVLTGGEIPATVLIDSVARLVPGVLSDQECFINESHYSGLLEYPQYSRPAEYMGYKVPEVLMGGHHAKIEEWRRRKMIERTYMRRPDILSDENLSDEDNIVLKDIIEKTDESDKRG